MLPVTTHESLLAAYRNAGHSQLSERIMTSGSSHEGLHPIRSWPGY